MFVYWRQFYDFASIRFIMIARPARPTNPGAIGFLFCCDPGDAHPVDLSTIQHIISVFYSQSRNGPIRLSGTGDDTRTQSRWPMNEEEEKKTTISSRYRKKQQESKLRHRNSITMEKKEMRDANHPSTEIKKKKEEENFRKCVIK